MSGNVAYVIGLIVNGIILVFGFNYFYRLGVKDGVRRAVINVLKNEGIVEEKSSRTEEV